MEPPRNQGLVLFILFILLSSLTIPHVSASGSTDTDGDGVIDNSDDCPNAWGNSTIDRQACPDSDGDGTSDLNDPWVMPNGGFLQDAFIASSEDMVIALFSPDNATHYITALNDDGGWGADSTQIKVMNTATRNTVRTVNLNNVMTADIAWSPDGSRFAVHTTGEELRVYHTLNGSLDFDVDTNGETAGEVDFSPDGSIIAVTGYRDGNNGDGQVQIFNSTTGVEITSFSPGSGSLYYALDFSPDGNFLVVGGYQSFYIYHVSNWSIFRTVTPNFSYMNAIKWSPDGTMIAVCEGWGGSNARERVYHALNGTQLFISD